MATIYPEDQRYHHPDSHAERELYPLLAALPDDYTVYCNRRYHARSNGRPQQAEADFLIAHPDRGILVLEAKSGVVSYEPSDDRWLQNGEAMDRDPFEQVDRASRLLRKMLADGRSSGIEFPTAEGLALPHSRVGPTDMPERLLPERVIDGDDLDDLQAAVVRAFDTFNLTDNSDRFGRRGVRALTEAVADSIAVARHIGREVAVAEDEVVRLTENQYRVLDQLDGNPRVCVLGGAGTGKTLLAMEQARRLAARGLNVLLTCFNQPLGEHIKTELGDTEGVDVLRFHMLCRLLTHEARIDDRRPDGMAEKDYYANHMASLLADAAIELGPRYDTILIDEAQDFPSHWIDTLQLLLKEEREGVLYLFADSNQAIYRRDFAPPAGFMRFTLTDNLRNCATVHALLVEHFGEQSHALGPQGVDVGLRTCIDDSDVPGAVSSLLSHLGQHGVPMSKVAVLTGRSTAKSRLTPDKPLGAFRLCSKPTRDNDVRFESVHRFKGLESAVVILCEMGAIREEARHELWYTAISRAQASLWVVATVDEGTDLEAVLTRALQSSS